MKSIRDDAAYVEAEKLHNELHAKKAAIDAEINSIMAISHSQRPPLIEDPIEAALALEQGVSTAANTEHMDRLPTLRKQSETLQRAIRAHSTRLETTLRDAYRKVLAANSGDYIAHATQMLELIDKTIELNKTLQADERALYDKGVLEMPSVRFPEFGLHEQLPHWRDQFDEQLRLLKHTVRSYS